MPMKKRRKMTKRVAMIMRARVKAKARVRVRVRVRMRVRVVATRRIKRALITTERVT